MVFSADQMERYGRQFILPEIGATGQKTLLNARVLIVGAGGLGAPLIQYLAAAGVGTLGVVDDDKVDLSNLHRQVIHTMAYLGRPKTDSAAHFVSGLNPDVTVVPHALRMTQDDTDHLIKTYDLVADCTDNFSTRFLIHDACFRLRRTLVQAAAIHMSGQLSVYKPHMDPTYPCYRCLIPEPPMGGAVPTCATGGILGAVTGVMGAWQGIEVIKELLGIGHSLAGRLMIFDGLSARTRTVRVQRDPQCPLCSMQAQASAN